MVDRTLNMLRRYLNGDIDFDALGNHIIALAPNAKGELRDLLDQIAIEIFYVWDGVSDETLFRERIPELVGLEPDSAHTADGGVIAV